ncbi:MAG: hypothetical protein ACK4Z7_05395 [Novosphingobium sp.]
MRSHRPRIRPEIVLAVLGLLAFAALLFSGADGARTIVSSQKDARSSGQDPGPAPWNQQPAGPAPMAGGFDDAVDAGEPVEPEPELAEETGPDPDGGEPEGAFAD